MGAGEGRLRPPSNPNGGPHAGGVAGPHLAGLGKAEQDPVSATLDEAASFQYSDSRVTAASPARLVARAPVRMPSSGMWTISPAAVVSKMPLCKARYAALRARGQGHAHALRSAEDHLLAVACAMLTTQSLPPAGTFPRLADPRQSSGSFKLSLWRILSHGCRIVGSEGEALEVVVNASVLRLVRAHEVLQSPEHFVVAFGS